MLFGEKALTEVKALYETRIEELKTQYEARIADLQRMVFSQTSASQIPLVALEADAIISQKEETIQVSYEEMTEDEAEANRILSGNY